MRCIIVRLFVKHLSETFSRHGQGLGVRLSGRINYRRCRGGLGIATRRRFILARCDDDLKIARRDYLPFPVISASVPLMARRTRYRPGTWHEIRSLTVACTRGRSHLLASHSSNAKWWPPASNARHSSEGDDRRIGGCRRRFRIERVTANLLTRTGR